MSTKNISIALATFSLSLCTSGITGCGSAAQDQVQGNAQIKNLSQGLMQNVTITSIGGQYKDNTCIEPSQRGALKRPIGTPWSAAVPYQAGSGPNAVLNDSSCQLEVSTLSVRDAAGTTQIALPEPPSPFSFSKKYLATPVTFTYTDTNMVKKEFYVNLMVTPDDFSTNFVIAMIYSDTPRLVTPPTTVAVNYATVTESQITALNVPAPDYVLSFTGMTLSKDANLKVVAATGQAALTVTAGGQIGEGYTIQPGPCPALLSDVQAAYKSGTVITTPLSASALGLSAGIQLPLSQCLILSHSDMAGAGLSSFELFQITFS